MTYSRPALTTDEAKRMVEFVMADVKREPGWEPGSVAIVNQDGALIAFLAEDECNQIGRQGAIIKAVTAASLSHHTHYVRQRSSQMGYNTFNIGIPTLSDSSGGIVIYHPQTGHVLGAIGCTHWGAERDRELGRNAIESVGLVHEPPPGTRLHGVAEIKFLSRRPAPTDKAGKS